MQPDNYLQHEKIDHEIFVWRNASNLKTIIFGISSMKWKFRSCIANHLKGKNYKQISAGSMLHHMEHTDNISA